ncbi:MAG: hypothetical protein EAZ07_02690 [Cytophagales bacterium]|nr:MAG: hypothetical protein EAZ07_02690 [Cytophagales bacterium]
MKLSVKFYLLLFIFFGFTQSLLSQDIIHLQNGSTINAKVVEIGLSVVLYNKSGQTSELSINKKEIHKIVYSNGTEEIFNTLSPPPNREIITTTPPPSNTNTPKNSSSTEPKNNGEKSAYIGMALGACTPLGDLGDIRISNPKSGYMLSGFNFQIEGGYYLFKYLALSSKIFSNTYGRDDAQMSTALERIRLSQDNLTAKSTVSSEYSSLAAFLFGAKLRLPIQKFTAELGLWGGFAATTLGNIKSNETYDLNGDGFIDLNDGFGLTVTYPELNSEGFARGFDLSFKYDILDRLYLGVQFDMLVHRTTFDNYKISFENNNTGEILLSDELKAENFAWRSFNTSFCIGYNFRKKK